MIDDARGGVPPFGKLNKIRIITLIRDNRGISRAEIGRRSGLSAPTVSRIVDELIRDRLVREMGAGRSQGGRRPLMLKFSARDNFIVGIDLGTTVIHGVLADFNAVIHAEEKVPTVITEGFAPVMDRTAAVVDRLLHRRPPGDGRIFGIGLAVAGLVNRTRGIVEFSPNFRWHNVDAAGELSRRFDVPVIFDNVTRVMAIGELCYGAGRTCRNFICVNVGYGIGAGIVVDGAPLYGPLGMAGEFGHITVDKDSPIQCDCGNFGCLETLASGNAIAKTARRELAAGARSALRDACGGDLDRISAGMVAAAAAAGDPVAGPVFDRAMDYLGVGVSCLINLFSPAAVVIGGGVAQSGDILFDAVRRTVNARALSKIAAGVEIRPAVFGLKAAVLGAVSLVLREVINQEALPPV